MPNSRQFLDGEIRDVLSFVAGLDHSQTIGLGAFRCQARGHSIRREVPRFFAGRLPDLNLGTADGASCAPAFQHAAALVLAGAAGFSSVVNGRFKGGYVTRHYGTPARGVHALQLETAQACYMDESPPYPWDATRAAPLMTLLARLVEALLATHPGH